MKLLIILAVVYLPLSHSASLGYSAEWQSSAGAHGSYFIPKIGNDPYVVKLDEVPRSIKQLPEELPTSTEKVVEKPKEELAPTKTDNLTPNDQLLQESLDDEGPVSITGPVSQFISQSAPSSSNSHLLASNTVTSNVPGSGVGGGPNIPTSGLHYPASGLNVPATGITIPIQSLLGPNVPLVSQNVPLSGSILPAGHLSGGLLSGSLLHHVQALLHQILSGHHSIIRPAHLSPGNVLLPGYSIHVGPGGITLPGITRH